PNKDKDDNNNNGKRDSLIFLLPTGKLKEEEIVTKFIAKPTNSKKGSAGFIELELNHKYDRKTIISDLYDDNWSKTIKQFSDRAKQKGVSKEHILLLTDLMDDNASKIISVFGTSRKEAKVEDLFLDKAKEQIVAVALDFIQRQTTKLFLNQVNTPYIAIKVKNHTETMPLESRAFQDWLSASFYHFLKEAAQKEVHGRAERSLMMAVRVLSAENIKNIQTILRFEADKTGDTITLNSRVVSSINEEDPSESRIYYDLCNKDWDIVRITASEWGIERNYPKILFKRHSVNKAQVLPNKDYPKDKNYLEEFMKLTNVYDDHDNKLIAQVYLVTLFLLADLPKPVMMPHGTHGSGKSTFQEFNKQVVDPSAAPTTAFPNSLAELVQELDHSYLTFFDNVSEISTLTSDTLCRVVTGSGLTKRQLYSDDEDIIYNLTRAVGFNGINVTATRPDLLDRLLSLHLYPIDRRQRKKLKVLRQEFDALLPNLLGYIFDILVKVLGRIGEVKLQELPRMADFAEMGELVARCLGYKDNEFTEAYNRNIGFTNQEAIESSPVATVIIAMMEKQPIWSGKAEKLRVELNKVIASREELSGLMRAKEWPKSARAMRARLNEVTPNLKEIGIVVDFKYDSRSKTDNITLVNNYYTLEPNQAAVQESKFWQVFDELAKESPTNQVGHDELRNSLVASGLSKEEAIDTMNRMIELGKLELAAVDTYRRAMSRISL
ncbi:MAG: hypothetical protein WBQ25_03985, partial [Nitrososphaeraceae archaeon]